MSQNRRSRGVLAAAAAASVALALTACSGGSAPSSSSSSSSGGTITVAADPTLLPYNFYASDGTTWQGIDVDLAAELSKKLGATLVFKDASFDSIIPGLKSGRYDMALTGMFDLKEREKTVDFVDYLGSKNDFLEPTSVASVSSFADLCGLTIGLPSGATEITTAKDASATCVKDGKKAITVNVYKDLSATTLALTSGRVQVTPNDSAANAYILKNNPSKGLKVSGSYDEGGYFAAAFPKESALTKKVQKAFEEIIADGSYGKVLAKWGVADRAVPKPIINGSTF